jgi:uncharacterized membrane protein
MHNLRKTRLCVCAAILALSLHLASGADAAVKITIKNNRSHTMSFAFCWAGFDYPDDVSNGWYNVKAGETRTITLKNAVYALTFKNFGYYAKGTPEGGKTLYWKGKGGDEYMAFYIHHKQSFTGSHDDPIDGGQKADFRKVNLKKVSQEDGSATLTFNP